MSGKPTHGLSRTPEYRAWKGLVQRCTNPDHPAYGDYGGRGIAVCERWLDDVEAFIEDMGPRPSPRHELDRIDNDGPYSPENCRWTTVQRNARNRRSNRRITYRGETRTLAGWCELLGLPSDSVRKRLEAGWSKAKAFGTAVRAKSPAGQGLRNPSGTCIQCHGPAPTSRKTCSDECLTARRREAALAREARKREARS